MRMENTTNAITVCSAHHSALSVCAGLVNVYLKFIHTEVLISQRIHKYVGTYGGTLVAAVTLGLRVDCPREPCPFALLENVVVLALKRVPALLF